MIKVFGRLLCVPESEKMLGFVNDNLVETRQFKITDPALFSFSFKLELENGSLKNIMDLAPEFTEEALLLSWKIPAECLLFPGPVFAQLRAFSEKDEVWHSEIAEFTVSPSIDAESALPPIVPSEFSEMEKRMTENATKSENAAVLAKASATEAATHLASITESAEMCKENADFSASVLTDVSALFTSVSSIQNEISTKEKVINEATETVLNQTAIALEAARIASEKRAEVLADLGDMHSALDAILALETTYMGGNAA